MIYRGSLFCLASILLLRPVAAQSVTNVPIESIVTVPQDFKVEVYARGQETGTPTVLAFGPDDRLYVLGQEGRLNRFEDRNGDGYAETQTTLYSNTDNVLSHAVGLAWSDDKIYVSDSGRISILSDVDADGQFDTVRAIVEGLISLKYWGHSNNGIAFGPDDKLYVGVGSTTDHGPIRFSGEAEILRMNPDGSDLEVFATGFRNPYDLTFSPQGDLFTADNNPDMFDKSLRYLPSEELNHVRQGHFYGFPEVFGDPYPGHKSTAPVTNFYPSVASAGLVYYASKQFPVHYQNGVFVAQWGSIAQPVQARDIRNGYMVVYIPLRSTGDGTFTGDWEVFATFNQEEGEYRPVDVTVGPDGALYVLEFNHAVIYRIYYRNAISHESTSPQVTSPTVGETIFLKGANGAPACVTCHLLDPNTSGIGPSLFGLRDADGKRIAGLDERTYIRNSILNPNAYVVEGYAANLMYQEYRKRLTKTEIEALIDYVLSLSR